VIQSIGKTVTIVSCSDPRMVGLRGTLALESMHMLTIVSPERKVLVRKTGTVLQLEGNGSLLVGDEMNGRVEDRLLRGSKV